MSEIDVHSVRANEEQEPHHIVKGDFAVASKIFFGLSDYWAVLPSIYTILLEIDSTFCKVHQSACSGKKDKSIEVSRGGKNTKIHIFINDRMQVLKVI